MSSSRRTRRLLAVHRFAGLLLSAAMAFFACTGLLLLYGHQIDAALGQGPPAAAQGEDGPRRLADAVSAVQDARPSEHPVFLFQEPDEHPGLVFVGMAPRGQHELEAATPVAVELGSGRVLDDVDLLGTFSARVLQLHAELWVGPIGRLLTGALGLALLATIVTGALIYGPMMRRFAYGLVRWERARSLAVTDLHRLVGASAFGWLAVVTATGVLLSAGGLLLQYFAMTQMADLAELQADAAPITDVRNIDEVVANAEATAANRRFVVVIFPGADLSGPAHYSVLMSGDEGLEQRLLTFAVIDAHQPANAEVRDMPWYLAALLLSEPLHFGDYGGWPLRLVWTLFSGVTLFLALSGPWAYVARRRRRRRGELSES